jgi:phosphate-selective porin OprO/OprP
MGGQPANGRWSVGWFNRHPLASGPTPAGGNDFAGRVFFARGGATDEKSGDKSHDSTAVVHLGATAAWSGAVNDSLRFRAKPEVNSAPNFVDTKSFPSHGAATLGLDALAQRRNVSLISEVLVTRASVVHRAPGTFLGYYAEASWRPTGEPRGYDASRGTFGRVKQRAQRGAFEVGARFSHTDLSSGTLDGGVFDRVSGVASWYSRWSTRLDVGYGFGTLTRDGATGRTHFFIMRAQWELL